jgi:sugar lactone lactonase YvrE
LSYSGDGGAASKAQLNTPQGVAADSAGNLYIADTLNNVVRKVSPNGTISNYAGNGGAGSSGDGSAATSAQLHGPQGLAVDASGNLFIADTLNAKVRKVSASGVISTVAGSGTPGYGGDGAAAASAQLNLPIGVAVDSSGNLYIADLATAGCARSRPITSAPWPEADPTDTPATAARPSKRN